MDNYPHRETDGYQGDLVSYSLGEELNNAIQSGQVDEINVAIELQPVNDVTESLSNALRARNFLYETAQELESLKYDFITIDKKNEALVAIGKTRREVQNIFTDAFVVSEASDMYAKLEGDDLFREILADSDESVARIAQRLAGMSESDLRDAADIYKEMTEIWQLVVANLEAQAVLILQEGPSAATVAGLEEMVGHCIDVINRKVESYFPDPRHS